MEPHLQRSDLSEPRGQHLTRKPSGKGLGLLTPGCHPGPTSLPGIQPVENVKTQLPEFSFESPAPPQNTGSGGTTLVLGTGGSGAAYPLVLIFDVLAAAGEL